MKLVPIIIFLLAIGLTNSNAGNLTRQHDLNTVKNTPTQEENNPGFAVFAELGGKGFWSGNIDFAIKSNHRISLGVTKLDYDFSDDYKHKKDGGEYFTPGIMYYYLIGKKKSFFELGAGVSVHPVFDKEMYVDDSPVSLHGVIGYRYQKENGLLFRAGFTPFKRINNWFLPLVGISIGYSW